MQVCSIINILTSIVLCMYIVYFIRKKRILYRRCMISLIFRYTAWNTSGVSSLSAPCLHTQPVSAWPRMWFVSKTSTRKLETVTPGECRGQVMYRVMIDCLMCLLIYLNKDKQLLNRSFSYHLLYNSLWWLVDLKIYKSWMD